MLLRQHAVERVGYESRVAKEAVAVDIGVPHRLGYQMDRLRRRRSGRAEIPARQHIQHLAQDRAAGARRRRRQDPVTAIGTADRRHLGRGVGREILLCEDAALRRRGGGDGSGDRAAVEGVGPTLGDQRQCFREIGLHEAVAGGVRTAVRAQTDARRLRVLAEPFGAGCDDRRVRLAERETVARQRDRRRHDGGAAELSVTGQRIVETHHRARHAGREIAIEAALADGIAGRVEKHAGGRGARRGLAEIDDGVMPVGGVDQHKAAAADIAAARIDDGERVADRDRRIDRVAAGLQDAQPRVARLMLRRDDHAALAFRRRRGRRDSRRR